LAGFRSFRQGGGRQGEGEDFGWEQRGEGQKRGESWQLMGVGDKKIFVFLSKKPHFSLTKVLLVVNFQSILTY